MAMFPEIALSIAVYSDSSKISVRFKEVLENSSPNSFTAAASDRINLPVGASDVAVSFQSVANGQLLILRSDKSFQVKINGTGNPAITLTPRTNSTTSVVTPAFLAVMANGITSLHLTNPGTEAVVVDFGLAGV